MTTASEVKAADVFEDCWIVGYYKARRDFKERNAFNNKYQIKSPQWSGYEGYREALKLAQVETAGNIFNFQTEELQ